MYVEKLGMLGGIVKKNLAFFLRVLSSDKEERRNSRQGRASEPETRSTRSSVQSIGMTLVKRL